MDYIHVNNLEKYQPNYKDRSLIWFKIHFSMFNSDPEFEMLDEIDQWRFVKFIALELQTKKPIPIDPNYLSKKGFNHKKRSIYLTLKMLHTFVTTVKSCDTLSESASRRVEKSRVDKSRVEKSRVDTYVDWEQSTLAQWNSFCNDHPTLARIKEISEGRRTKLKKCFDRDTFRKFGEILSAIKGQHFLLGKNDRDWVVSFDWLIANDTNYLKVLERKYDEKQRTGIPEGLKQFVT